MDEGEVREFVDQAQATLEASPQMDEEATKFRLVIPFIELLGWDSRSTEVEPEHTVRMATGKTKVDFALQLGDTPVVFVEAKPARSSLDEDSIAQLRSYMRQELEVDWGVVTNGKSFEVLTKGDDGRQEEISLIQFELSDLKERPDLLEILSKESIQSGKSDEIATQIAQAGEAILHLQQNKEQVASDLNEVLLEEIGPSVPLDTQAQATEFVDGLISALEEQRRAIGTTSSPDEEREVSTPDVEDVQDTTGEYVIKITNGDTAIATFADDNQSDAMAEATNYFIENHDLISVLEPLPYVPGRKNALINDQPVHPDGKGEMRTHRELTNGYYLFTSFNKRDKKRHVQRFAEKCGLEVEFEGGW
ncbi:restriction endonuclease subunit R [Halorubrum sp. CBA1125]|uniref:type I restriction enzyme HsdR N-terminal domain-containing protein n=1 Tax=Halorubrum sp. CBA1125 TaxID=2668072 RepID=UPI0012E9363F|nr:type I restriction enzyme HsdR N-terminal domain-containing protein [Halorubrum sp. CBA1125]MUW14227.1 restriction endonuclease subunit R [Halorubrum sp. CBA1125]